MGHVYAVASAKGGVGKTTTTANLAATLAARGHRVVAVDTDLGMANLAATLGVAANGSTVHDVLAGEADVGAATYEAANGLQVVPGSSSLEDYAAVDPTALDRVLEDLAADYDYVVLDTGAGLSHDTVLPLELVDEAVLVSTDQRDALIDTDKTRDLAERLGATVAGVVLTRVDPDDPNTDDVNRLLNADVLEAIPEDGTVTAATAAGEPLPVHAPDSPAAGAYRALADTLLAASDDADGAAEIGDETEAAGSPARDADGAAPDEPADSSEGSAEGPADEAAVETTDAPDPDEHVRDQLSEAGSGADQFATDAAADEAAADAAGGDPEELSSDEVMDRLSAASMDRPAVGESHLDEGTADDGPEDATTPPPADEPAEPAEHDASASDAEGITDAEQPDDADSVDEGEQASETGTAATPAGNSAADVETDAGSDPDTDAETDRDADADADAAVDADADTATDADADTATDADGGDDGPDTADDDSDAQAEERDDEDGGGGLLGRIGRLFG